MYENYDELWYVHLLLEIVMFAPLQRRFPRSSASWTQLKPARCEVQLCELPVHSVV